MTKPKIESGLAADLIIAKPSGMTPETRKLIADWLRKQAKQLEVEGQFVDWDYRSYHPMPPKD